MSDFIDGLLSVDERLAVESHLDGCAGCAGLRGQMAEAVRWARSFTVHAPPADLVSRILDRTLASGIENRTCDEVREQLSEYLDGLLGRAARMAVEEHLAACGACEDAHQAIAAAIRSMEAAPSYAPPEWLVGQILANTPQDRLVDCSLVRERLSDLIEDRLSPDDDVAVTAHLADCESCREIQEDMKATVDWGLRFPTYEPPEWLATRILANTRDQDSTPTIKETWLDTVAGMARWILEPRTAMTVFTAVLVLGWISSISGFRWEPAALTNPTEVYYSMEELADDVYDRSVRLYYGVPHALLDEIQFRIEQMRESS